jgi:hypothetical protein
MLSLAFSLLIVAVCGTFIWWLLKFFKSQLKTSYKMVSKFQTDCENLMAEKRELEAFIDKLLKEQEANKTQQKPTRNAKPNI